MARLEDGIGSSSHATDCSALIFKCCCGDTLLERHVTYGQLFRLMSHVQAVFSRANISRGDVVALLLPVDEFAIVVLLSVLGYGCAFVALNSDDSPTFNETVMDAANAVWFISAQSHGKLQVIDAEGFTIGDRRFYISRRTTATVTVGGVAYVMCTSGTTGRPKIVRVPHSSIRPNIDDLRTKWEIVPSDVVLLASPLTFDPSMVELFVALTASAVVLIPCQSEMRNSTKLRRMILEEGVLPTILQMTPTLFGLFGEEAISGRILAESSTVRVLVLGGETFPLDLVRRLRHQNNRTRIFNIYGITEVSCWATMRQLDTDHWTGDQLTVDIGCPLSETSIRLAPLLQGDVGDFEVVIASDSRMCTVDGEVSARERRTGDLATIDASNRITLLGRVDDQIKRGGKRINLVQIEQAVSVASGECCTVAFDSTRDLLCCAVVSVDSVSEVSLLIGKCRLAAYTVLPLHCRPDCFRCVSNLPLSKHGKIDRLCLLSWFSQPPQVVYDGKSSVSDIVESLLSLHSLDCSMTFSDLGLKSLKAIELLMAAEKSLNVKLPPNTLEQLLDASFTVFQFERLVGNSKIASAKRCVDPDILPATKSSQLVKRQRVAVSGVSVSLLWCWDSGKCIDASAVVEEGVVFVGSHSGRFGAISLVDGKQKWCFDAPDRIEATAAIASLEATNKLKLVVFGCYDKCVYFLHCSSGEIHWCFATNDVVKCTPVVHHLKLQLFIGSHDQNIYCLDYKEKSVVWKTALDGSVVATPYLNASLNEIYVATLSGTVWQMQADTGEVLNSFHCPKPIFGAITVLNGNTVVIPCVDGYLYFISVATFCKTGQYYVGGNIFGGCVHSSSGKLLVGSTTRLLYGLRMQSDGELAVMLTAEFTLKTNGSLVRPACIVARDLDGGLKIGVVISTNGVGMLFDNNGTILCRFDLNGECFSSPLAVASGDQSVYIIVGCRDNYLYCYKVDIE